MNFQNWPFRWFIPHPVKNWIDSAWSPHDMLQLCAYLTDCPGMCSSSSAKCELCGEPHNNSEWKWDGTWLWPGDLAHMVSRHQVRLPDAFVESIRSRSYMPAAPETRDWKTAPWPTEEELERTEKGCS